MPTLFHALQLPVATIIVLCCLPAHAAAAQGSDAPSASPLERTVDASIRPGDDFFAFANGAWLKAATIPAGRERWGVRDELNALTRPHIAKLIDNAAAAARGSDARKVSDFRAAWLNQAGIEARDLTPLRPLLDTIGRVGDKAALTRLLGHLMPADVDPLNLGVYRSSHVLGFAVERSIHGERTNDVFLVQGGLGLGDRDNYLGAEPRLTALRAAYVEYVGRMLQLAGFDRAVARARSVMALETAMAKSQGSAGASANDHNADTRWTSADFAREAPGMDWAAFLGAAGLGRQAVFGVWQPGSATGLAAAVAAQPLESWKDYLRFHALDRYSDLLPQAFAGPAVVMHAAAANEPLAPRAERALAATQAALGEPIGRMYVERNFPAAEKARVQGIVANVVEAFARRIESLVWMSPASRAVALAKVKSLYVGIGYPDRWQDYSDLAIDPADALGNARRVADRNTRRALRRIGQPVDMTEWWIAPQSVGGVLIFQQNAYEISAALLQAPKYDSTASDAATYGAIGAVIGHDVTHFVDLLGADYDTTFAIRRWWTAEDLASYQAAYGPLVDQFATYRPYPDLAVDGKLTAPENVADLAGLEAAFDAYRRSLGARTGNSADVQQHDREFFIAFAQSWRARISDSAMRVQLKTNDHAPEMFRVSTVRNLDAWYAAFDVAPGQRLYLEPAARVHVW
ncbi:MAG: M13 family metallopeptidase [Gemmatimonadota bacterium]